MNILQPVTSVEGNCIPVDHLTARKTNDSMPTHVLSRIRDIMREHNIQNITKVGIYGLTYKEL